MSNMASAKAMLDDTDKQRSFHGLPPLKRFKLLHKESSAPIFCLPAKKRIWAVQDFMAEHQEAMEEEEKALSTPTLEGLGKMAIESGWSNPKRKRSQKALHKRSGSTKVKIKVQKPNLKASSLKNSQEGENPQENDDDDDNDGIVCNVCSGQDGDPSDPIVFCDGCDIMVHTTCYGDPLIKGVPEGNWFCARCMHNAGNVSCSLCPSTKGAMKCTTENSWAHISCALLVPEVFFQCPEEREGIDCSMVPPMRWEMDCSLCNLASGACIECSEPRCPATFHVSCGLDRDFHIEYKETKAGGLVIGFCNVHTPKWKIQQETGKFKIVPRERAKSSHKRGI